MYNHCGWGGVIGALLVILFSFWQTAYSKWIIVIVAVLWLIHSLGCKDCCAAKAKPKARRAKPKKRKKKRR